MSWLNPSLVASCVEDGSLWDFAHVNNPCMQILSRWGGDGMSCVGGPLLLLLFGGLLLLSLFGAPLLLLLPLRLFPCITSAISVNSAFRCTKKGVIGVLVEPWVFVSLVVIHQACFVFFLVHCPSTVFETNFNFSIIFFGCWNLRFWVAEYLATVEPLKAVSRLDERLWNQFLLDYILIVKNGALEKTGTAFIDPLPTPDAHARNFHIGALSRPSLILTRILLMEALLGTAVVVLHSVLAPLLDYIFPFYISVCSRNTRFLDVSFTFLGWVEGFKMIAKHLKSLDEVCTLEIIIDQLSESDVSPLTEVFPLVNFSELDAVDVIHSSSCVVFNGQDLLALIRSIGPKLRMVDLKDVSLGKDALRDLLKRGLSCQVLNLSSCRARKLNMTGQFLALHTLKLDFNVCLTSLPEGCFSSMPKLTSLSMCETRIANLWTTSAALLRLPSLLELRFQNCLCCNDTGQCPLSSTEKTNSFLHESLGSNESRKAWSMDWSIDREGVKFPDSDSSGTEDETFNDMFSDDESVIRHHLVQSSSEDSSDESDVELQFHLQESVPLEARYSDTHQETNFLGSLSVGRNAIADTVFNDDNGFEQPSAQVVLEESFFEREGGFYVREGEVTFTTARRMVGGLDDASDNVFDNNSLDAFYDAAERSTPGRVSLVSNGEGTSGDEPNIEYSVMPAGIALRRNASHHPSPICFEKHYREFMISSLPRVKVLDNLPVTQLERERAQTVFAQYFESLPYNRKQKENIIDILRRRETGAGTALVSFCKGKQRSRNSVSGIAFSRSICAAKMASCAWPATRPISKLKKNPSEINRKFRPRQFEYHPCDPSLMVFGTLDGEVVVINHESGKIVGHVQSVGATHSILGLCWLNKDPAKLIAGSDNGTLQLYDVNQMRSTISVPGRYGANSSNRNPASYTYEEFEQLTSVHINATDDYFLASGYSKHVALYDVQSGKRLQVFEDLHREHINVVKFAHHFPYMFATSSFDQEVKMWDLRQKPTRPLYTTASSRGNVMVCFSRDDHYILSSAVDNEVKQHLAVDGRLHMRFDIASTGSPQNYTRSYYMNGRDYIISGSCEENVVRICCAHTGRRLRDLALETILNLLVKRASWKPHKRSILRQQSFHV
eukprot:Gb_13353 [translate_table: standard]